RRLPARRADGHGRPRRARRSGTRGAHRRAAQALEFDQEHLKEPDMKPRMEYWKVAPGGYKAMASLEAYLRESGLAKPLLHMVKLRASQMNGCAYCIDMHWKAA